MEGGWGIDSGYWDAVGQWRDAPQSTLEAIRVAMDGEEGRDEPPPGPPVWFVRAGRVEFLRSPANVTLEDGSVLRGIEALPPDLPPGYHDLAPLDGGPVTRLVVSPGRCHLPHELHAWGWAVQLYAARSRSSWGMGDLADLRRLSAWAGRTGAGVMGVNPLHAAGPASPQQASPYYPSSRLWRSPLYLRVEEVPGAGSLGVDLERLAAEGRALNSSRLIDRDRGLGLEGRGPRALLPDRRLRSRVREWRTDQGTALEQFATYCAIAEVHGNGWAAWPSELRRPDSEAVSRLATERSDRVRYHAWLQWLVDGQLAAAATLPLMADLAVGFDPGGADAWTWQDVLALDMRIGAPADEFNTAGQDWGLPPFVPWKLRAAAYQPVIETVRAALRSAGGLRIDHVMGLFRLFWIPSGSGPTTGTYVRYPAAELLDIVALESHRARAFVVGEDLGTVEDAVRAELAERRVLSYRLLWFEREPPEAWPAQALAAVTTHDLPTVAGLWTGADVTAQRADRGDPERGGGGRRPGPAGGARRARATTPRWTPWSPAPTGPSVARPARCCWPRWTTPSASRSDPTCPGPSTSGRTGRSPSPPRSRRSRRTAASGPWPASCGRPDRGDPGPADLGTLSFVVIEPLTLWLAATNAWIVAPDGPGGECVLVDAPPEPGPLLERLAALELRLVALISTHGHIDHVGRREHGRAGDRPRHAGPHPRRRPAHAARPARSPPASSGTTSTAST